MDRHVVSGIASGNVLAIEVKNAQAIVAELEPQNSVVHARFAALDRQLLDCVTPICVMFPLFSADFDAFQVIERLNALGYCGKICVVTPSLPAPDMVLAELRALTARQTLQLIEIVA